MILQRMKSTVVRELRAVQRFRIELPVVLTASLDRSNQPFEAVTRDISTRGMFVISPIPVAEGQIVEFEIDLSWDHLTPLVLVQGEGRVVRTGCDPESSAAGFAVHNLWFKLRPPAQGQAIPADDISSGVPLSPDPAARAQAPRLSILGKNGKLTTRGAQ